MKFKTRHRPDYVFNKENPLLISRASIVKVAKDTAAILSGGDRAKYNALILKFLREYQGDENE